jgi:hypothetical protein
MRPKPAHESHSGVSVYMRCFELIWLVIHFRFAPAWVVSGQFVMQQWVTPRNGKYCTLTIVKPNPFRKLDE